MNATQHLSNNTVLGAPGDWGQQSIDCHALAITRLEVSGLPAMVSFWKPTADELADLNAGGAVSLWVFGAVHPPVSVQVEPPADGQIQRGGAAPIHPPASAQVQAPALPLKEKA